MFTMHRRAESHFGTSFALTTLAAWLVGVALLAAGPTAQAQTVYKQVMPNGQVVYSDRPIAGASKSEEVRILRSTTTTEDTAASPAPAQDSSEAQTNADTQRRLDDSRTLLDAANARIENAKAALAAAERELQQGREVQPGERVGNTKNAYSRLTESYSIRVKQLEDNVASAREELMQAEEARTKVQ